MLEYFIKGGAFMYPILACSLVSVAVIVERLIRFLRTRDKPAALRRAEELVGKGDLAALPPLLAKERGTAAEFLAAALAGVSAGDVAARRAELERKGDEILRRLGRFVHLLELIERLAPLFGFLGTVTGMVLAFGRVAAAEGPVRPSLIADGIWQALITTVAGLLVAIPALIASHFFTIEMRARAERMRSLGETLLAPAGENAVKVTEDADARLP
jgi:biopolymer transport protein ExbB